MADLSDVARVLFAIGCGTGLLAAIRFIADHRERRKWRSARRQLPFILD